MDLRSGVAENGLKRIDLATLDRRARRRRSRADRIERREVERERSDLNPVPFTESGRSCVNSRKIATGQHRLRRNSEAMVVAAWRPMPVWWPVMRTVDMPYLSKVTLSTAIQTDPFARPSRRRTTLRCEPIEEHASPTFKIVDCLDALLYDESYGEAKKRR